MRFNWTNPTLRTTLTILTGVVCVTVAVAASGKDPERGRFPDSSLRDARHSWKQPKRPS